MSATTTTPVEGTGSAGGGGIAPDLKGRLEKRLAGSPAIGWLHIGQGAYLLPVGYLSSEGSSPTRQLRSWHETISCVTTEPSVSPNATLEGSQFRSLPGPSNIQAVPLHSMVACTRTCETCGLGEVVLGRCRVRKSALFRRLSVGSSSNQ